MSGPPSVHTDIRAFGELCARYNHPFSERAEVLSGAGLTPAQWAELRGSWCARLGQEGEGLAREFGAAYAAQWAAGPSGRSTAVAAAGGGAMAPSMEVASAAAAAAVAVGVPKAPVVIEAASGAPPAAQARPVAVPSFLRERSGAPAMVAPAMVASPVADFQATTGPMDMTAMLEKAAIPFNPSAVPSIPQASPTATGASGPAPRSPGIGDTGDVDVSAIARKVLAFGPPAKTPPAPVSPVSAAPAPPGPLPAFTVDQYALLSAEIVLVADPAARAAVFARFGVDDPDALTSAWRARFAADPALAGRWSAAYAEHYARLRSERGGLR